MQKRAADALMELLWGIRTRRDVGINVLGKEFEPYCLLEAVPSEVRRDDSYVDVALLICAEFGFKEGDFPVTEFAGRTSIAIPSHNHLTAEKIDHAADVLERALGEVQ